MATPRRSKRWHAEVETGEPAGAELRIQNKPSSALGLVPLNLQQVAVALAGRFGENTFRAVCVRLYYPEVTVLLFRTGNYVVVGAKTTLEVASAIAQVNAMLAATLGVFTQPVFFRVNNAVFSAKLGVRINLRKLAHEEGLTAGSFGEYQPDVFPGVRIYPFGKFGDGSSMRIIIFETGRGVVTGASTFKESNRVWQQWRPRILRCAMLDSDAPEAGSTKSVRKRMRVSASSQ